MKGEVFIMCSGVKWKTGTKTKTFEEADGAAADLLNDKPAPVTEDREDNWEPGGITSLSLSIILTSSLSQVPPSVGASLHKQPQLPSFRIKYKVSTIKISEFPHTYNKHVDWSWIMWLKSVSQYYNCTLN